MTHAWQRCASGQWSVAVDCAQGTVCSPAGLTDALQVQFDPSYSGGGGGGSGESAASNGMSRGPRGRIGAGLLVGVVALWITVAALLA